MADITPEALSQLIELARGNTAPQIAPGANTPFVVIPNTMKVHELAGTIFNEHADRPERIKGTVKVFDSASFCQYYNLFADGNSRVFADEAASRVIAILDYHESPASEDNAARWGQHRIDLTLRYSQEWTDWKAQNGKKVSQMDFAEFLEDHAPDIVSPDAATMLEVARSLSAKTDVDFSSAIRMSNGAIQLKFNEQVKGTYGNGQFEVPETFDIGVPVYVGHDRVRLTARLRYRLNSGKLTFWFDLLRAAVAERDAFLAARSAIAQSLDIAIINGQAA
jgi:uncharacterized protein YfdQ (DUF2303 family)